MLSCQGEGTARHSKAGRRAVYRGHRHMQECGKQGSGPRAIAYAIIRIHGSQHDRFRRGGLVGGREQEAALHGVASFGASAH